MKYQLNQKQKKQVKKNNKNFTKLNQIDEKPVLVINTPFSETVWKNIP